MIRACITRDRALMFWVLGTEGETDALCESAYAFCFSCILCLALLNVSKLTDIGII